MKNFFERTLIISPHADDELFTFGLLYSPENYFNEIDILLIGCDKDREKETLISSRINKLKFINLPKNISCVDSFYHFNFKILKNYFLNNLINYDLILSPLIEGGHQDHDTVTAALLKCKECKSFNPKILLYSTYRSINIFPLLFRCGIPKGLFNDQRYYFSISFQGLLKFTKTILVAYKSQYISWLLITPFLLLAYICKELNSMVVADKLSLEYILKMSPERPLYQTYRNLNKSSWIQYIQN